MYVYKYVETEQQPPELKLTQRRRLLLQQAKTEEMKRRNLWTEAVLKEVIEEAFPHIAWPPEIEETIQGKPVFRDHPEAYFSLSHSGVYAACAAGEDPIGIDIQQVRHFNPAVCHRYFSEKEKKVIQSSEHPEETFTFFWAAKESLCKAAGLELTESLREDIPEDILQEHKKIIHRCREHIYELEASKPVNDYVVCICRRIDQKTFGETFS